MTRGRSAVVLLLAACSLLPATAAHADSDRLQVSQDGTTWQDNLSAPLFGPMVVVPQDRVSRSFRIRNDTDQETQATVALVDRSPDDSDLAGHLRVGARSGETAGSSHALTDGNGCSVLLQGQPLDPGATSRIDVALAVDDIEGGTAQGATAEFDLLVALSEGERSFDICGVGGRGGGGDGAGDGAIGCGEGVSVINGVGDDDCTSQPLPETGAPDRLSELLGIGALLLIIGGYLARRRREDLPERC